MPGTLLHELSGMPDKLEKVPPGPGLTGNIECSESSRKGEQGERRGLATSEVATRAPADGPAGEGDNQGEGGDGEDGRWNADHQRRRLRLRAQRLECELRGRTEDAERRQQGSRRCAPAEEPEEHPQCEERGRREVERQGVSRQRKRSVEGDQVL